jgi:hypothetical protein
MPKITVEKLFMSYGASLRAKVQMQEFAGWGTSMTDTFRKEIADHQALEAEYLIQLRAERQGETEAFKKKLEGK